MKSSLPSSPKRLFFLKLLTPLLFTAGLIGLGALSHCSKAGNPVDPGPGGDACANACTADQVCIAGSCTLQIPEAGIQTIAVSQVVRTDKIEGAIDSQSTVQDSQGNVYITGYFGGTVTLGDKTISCQFRSRDVFVAKIGLNGQVIWAKSFKNQSNDNLLSSGEAIAVDAQGNVYVGGYFEGVVKFDGVTLTSSLMDSDYTSREAFLTKLDANGAVVWAFKYEQSVGVSKVEAVAVDQQGSVIALARTERKTFAIIKYAANTTQNSTAQWTEKWDATDASISDTPELVTDAQGNILILINGLNGSIGTGSSNANSKFSKIESAKDKNNFPYSSNSLVKLAQDTGAIQWVSSLQYNNQSRMNLFMSQGSLVVMDSFVQGLSFGKNNTGNAIEIPEPAGDVSIYWSTWDLTTGNPIAAHGLKGGGRREFLGGVVDSQGNVWMISLFGNQSSYGSTSLQPVADDNIALVKLDTAGEVVWAERMNDAKSIFYGLFTVVFDAQNSPWLSFGFEEPTSIRGTQLTPKGNLFDFGFAKLKL